MPPCWAWEPLICTSIPVGSLASPFALGIAAMEPLKGALGPGRGGLVGAAIASGLDRDRQSLGNARVGRRAVRPDQRAAAEHVGRRSQRVDRGTLAFRLAAEARLDQRFGGAAIPALAIELGLDLIARVLRVGRLGRGIERGLAP